MKTEIDSLETGLRGLSDRRSFLTNAFIKFLGLLALFLTTPRRSAAQADFYKGTDFVGKTRKGKHEKFYINFFKPMRRIKEGRWQLKVTGLCESPRKFSLAQLNELPSESQVSRLKCVECWSAKAEWRGLRPAALEEIVRPLPEAKAVIFRCGDTYLESLDRKSLTDPRTLLAYEMNGERLSDEHGFPLRLIIPSKYGYKNPKAILEMEYVSESQYGTWSKIGPYSTDGTILPGYDHPLDKGKKRSRIHGGEILDGPSQAGQACSE